MLNGLPAFVLFSRRATVCSEGLHLMRQSMVLRSVLFSIRARIWSGCYILDYIIAVHFEDHGVLGRSRSQKRTINEFLLNEPFWVEG